MTPIYIGQDKLTPQQKDNETLAEAIERQAQEMAKREPLLADQGKMDMDEISEQAKLRYNSLVKAGLIHPEEGGLDEPKVQDD
jgi:cell division protein FtsB